MHITDEMVKAACLTLYEECDIAGHWVEMREALEAALGQFMLQYGDNVELQEAEQVGFNRSAACIEELAGALKLFAEIADCYDPPEDDDHEIVWDRKASPKLGDIRRARATLERWGLK